MKFISVIAIAYLIIIPQSMAGKVKLSSAGIPLGGKEAQSEKIDRAMNLCVQVARDARSRSSFIAFWTDSEVNFDGTAAEEVRFSDCVLSQGYR